FGTRGVNDETPPLLCLNSNPTFEPSGTVLNGQFDWGDLLPKGNISCCPSRQQWRVKNSAICWNIRESRATRSRKRTGDNAPGADNQQERPGFNLESSETIRRTSTTDDPRWTMIESVLYGDIQRPAEMPGHLVGASPPS